MNDATAVANAPADPRVVQKMIVAKDALGKAIYDLQTLVSTRHFEGMDDAAVKALKDDVNALSKHLTPLGEKIMASSIKLDNMTRPKQHLGPEGLPVLTDQQRVARNEGRYDKLFAQQNPGSPSVESLGQDASDKSDEEEEEVEEEDETGTKRKVRRPKAQARRK